MNKSKAFLTLISMYVATVGGGWKGVLLWGGGGTNAGLLEVLMFGLRLELKSLGGEPLADVPSQPHCDLRCRELWPNSADSCVGGRIEG